MRAKAIGSDVAPEPSGTTYSEPANTSGADTAVVQAAAGVAADRCVTTQASTIPSTPSASAAAGTAGIPAAGLVTMVIVIGAANAALAGRGIEPLPLSAVGVIIGVDRILDMSRTVLNVWGDCVAAKIISRYAPDEA